MNRKKFLKIIGLRCCTIPTKKMNRAEFRQASYSCWAVKELGRYINEHPETPLFYAVDDFRTMVDNFSCRTKGPEASYMFSVAYDVASNALDQLIAQNER